MKRLLLAATAAIAITAPAFAQEEPRFVFRAKAGVLQIASAAVPELEEPPFGEDGDISIRALDFDVVNASGDRMIRPGSLLTARVEVNNRTADAVSELGGIYGAAGPWGMGVYDRDGMACTGGLAAGAARHCTITANVTSIDVCSALAGTDVTIAEVFAGGEAGRWPDTRQLVSAPALSVGQTFSIDRSSCESDETLTRDDFDVTGLVLTFDDRDGDEVLSIGDRVRFTYGLRNGFRYEVEVQMGVGLPTGFSDQHTFIPAGRTRTFEHVIEATNENLALLRNWQTPENGSTDAELFAYVNVYSIADTADWTYIDIFDEFSADPLRVPLWGAPEEPEPEPEPEPEFSDVDVDMEIQLMAFYPLDGTTSPNPRIGGVFLQSIDVTNTGTRSLHFSSLPDGLDIGFEMSIGPWSVKSDCRDLWILAPGETGECFVESARLSADTICSLGETFSGRPTVTVTINGRTKSVMRSDYPIQSWPVNRAGCEGEAT